MKRFLLASMLLAAMSLACDRDSGPTSTSSHTPTTAPTAAAPEAQSEKNPLEMAATTPPPAGLAAVIAPPSAPALPRAEDVLPAGEVSSGSVVVVGDGFRFQIKPQFKHIDHPRSKFAYSATLEGMISPAELTVYATRDAFTGDLASLVKREKEAVTTAGGKVSEDGPVKLHIAGALGDAHRFLATIGGKLDMNVLAVHDGQAFIFHAQTPEAPNAWINVGSDMMIRGSTFHVAPPK